MKNTVKVLKNGMTVAELRAADLTAATELERELIELILIEYEYEDDDTVIDFEELDRFAVGRKNGEFYVTIAFHALNVTISSIIDLIEAEDGEGWWDPQYDEEE